MTSVTARSFRTSLRVRDSGLAASAPYIASANTSPITNTEPSGRLVLTCRDFSSGLPPAEAEPAAGSPGGDKAAVSVSRRLSRRRTGRLALRQVRPHARYMVPTMKRCALALSAVVLLVAAGSESARGFVVASGTNGSYTWQLRVARIHLRHSHGQEALCPAVWTSPASGQPLESGGGPCLSEPAFVTLHGVYHSWNLKGTVFPAIGGWFVTGPPFLRVTLALADPRARRVVWNLDTVRSASAYPPAPASAQDPRDGRVVAADLERQSADPGRGVRAPSGRL